MRLIVSFAALFLSVLLLAALLGGRGAARRGCRAPFWGSDAGQIGLLGSAISWAFFHRLLVGAAGLMGSVGHSRAFAAFTATGAIGLLAHMLVVDAYCPGR